MFDETEAVIADFAAGKFVIVLDDEDRENEGDLLVAASKITTEQMAWFIRHTRYAAVTHSAASSASRSRPSASTHCRSP